MTRLQELESELADLQARAIYDPKKEEARKACERAEASEKARLEAQREARWEADRKLLAEMELLEAEIAEEYDLEVAGRRQQEEAKRQAEKQRVEAQIEAGRQREMRLLWEGRTGWKSPERLESEAREQAQRAANHAATAALLPPLEAMPVCELCGGRYSYIDFPPMFDSEGYTLLRCPCGMRKVFQFPGLPLRMLVPVE